MITSSILHSRGRLLFFFALYLLFFIFPVYSPLEAAYIKRYSTTDNGGILFTGNTLGLSKKNGKNEPGSSDSAGAFITIDTTQKVGSYPAGTTLDWTKNSSFAFLDLPEESTVLYAELIWSGSYGFQNQITGSEPDNPISITTPQNVTFQVAPDPATSQTATTPGIPNCGNYTRSANVTSIVQQGGGGKYTVGRIPATISALDDTHNAAGWTLAVVFHNGQMLTYNMTLFVGCEQASYNTNLPASVEGFCAPPSGVLKGHLFISAIEGEANKVGDRMLFGGTLPLDIDANALSGTNNPIDNFFCSQINTLLPLNQSAISTKLVDNGSALLDTRGSFGNANSNPLTNTIAPGDRQGYDITSIDISNIIQYNQTSAYALGSTKSDDYTLNALGIQIQVGAPIITTSMLVNSQKSLEANAGDIVTFTCHLQNDGTSDAVSLVFKDVLEDGLEFVPGSLTYNQISQVDPDLVKGVSLGNLLIDQSATIQFQALVKNYPATGNIFYNKGVISYRSETCTNTFLELEATTNTVLISLPTLEAPNLLISKLVNSEESIDACIGEVVTFTLNIDSVGKGTALNTILKDPLPQGHTLVPNSVLLNNILMEKDPDLSVGIQIGDIPSGDSSKMVFQAKIDAYPPENNTYYYTANADYHYCPSADDTISLQAISNTVRTNFSPSSDPITPIIPGAPPPVSVKGVVKKCNWINRRVYHLKIQWNAPDASNILSYRIYYHGKVVEEVNAQAPLIYRICLKSKKALTGYKIAAVYPNNLESNHVKVKVSYE
ncbi:MAG: DUF11 domain-containing protein [Parachlamydiaceae bacterium]